MPLYTTNKISTLKQLIKSLSKAPTLNIDDIKRLCSNSIRYDKGKYMPTQKNATNMGVCPIWYECRQDTLGKHIVLYCIDDSCLGDLGDEKIHDDIMAVFKSNIKSI